MRFNQIARELHVLGNFTHGAVKAAHARKINATANEMLILIKQLSASNAALHTELKDLQKENFALKRENGILGAAAGTVSMRWIP